MTNFAQQCVATGRFDTQVPYQVIEIAKEMWSRSDHSTKPWKKYNLYPLIEKTLEGYAAHNPETQNENLSRLIHFAWLCEQPREVIRIWKMLDRNFDPEIKWSDNTIARQFRSAALPKVHAYASPAASTIMIADQAFQQGTEKQAIHMYERARSQLADYPLALAYIDGKLQTLTWKNLYSSGEWLDLKFDKTHSGWIARLGEWRGIDSNTVEGRSTKDGLALTLGFKPGRHFEFEMNFEFVNEPYVNNNNAGILLMSQIRLKYAHCASLLAYHSENKLMSEIHPQQDQETIAEPMIEKQNLMRFIMDGENATVYINDQKCYEGIWLFDQDDHESPELFNVGGDYWYPDVVIRFSNLRIKKTHDVMEKED